jgi:hypothetical protein
MPQANEIPVENSRDQRKHAKQATKRKKSTETEMKRKKERKKTPCTEEVLKGKSVSSK